MDSRSTDNGATQLTLVVDGVEVGRSQPTARRADLVAFTDQVAGFVLDCEDSFEALDVLTGRVSVGVVAAEGRTVLPLSSRLAATVRQQVVEALARQERGREDRAEALVSQEPEVLAAAAMPFGLRSSDDSARVGRDGQLFLTGGSNDLLGLYEDTGDHGSPGSPRGLAAQWTDRFERRLEGCESRGVQYLQTVLPEKTTVMRRHAPVSLDGPTPLYAVVDEWLARRSFGLSGLAPFVRWTQPEDPYLRTDTHFSTPGARAVFAALAGRVDPRLVPLVEGVELDEPSVERGDLSSRFYGLPLQSATGVPTEARHRELVHAVATTERADSPRGVVGSRFGFTNPAAPSPHSVLVFGNSFFQNGDRPRHLTWWAKCFFARVLFVWSPEVDWDVVDSFAPDVLVAQTVERFLRRVPSS